jgi:hypothetical protein
MSPTRTYGNVILLYIIQLHGFFLGANLALSPLKEKWILEGSGIPLNRRGETPLNKPLEDEGGTLPIVSR